MNLGCGSDYRKSSETEEWTNIDYCPKNKADIHINLEVAELPFDNASIDYVYANMIFEHIHNFVGLMIEIHRVMKPNSDMFVSVPLFPCDAAITDPEHCRFFTKSSFRMFCDPTEAPYFKGAGLFNILKLTAKVPVIKGYTEKECSDFSKVLDVVLQKVNWEKIDNKWRMA